MNSFDTLGPFAKIAVLNTIGGRITDGLPLNYEEADVIKGALREACGFYEILSRAAVAFNPLLKGKAMTFDASALNAIQLIARLLPDRPVDMESASAMRTFYQFQVERETK